MSNDTACSSCSSCSTIYTLGYVDIFQVEVHLGCIHNPNVNRHTRKNFQDLQFHYQSFNPLRLNTAGLNPKINPSGLDLDLDGVGVCGVCVSSCCIFKIGIDSNEFPNNNPSGSLWIWSSGDVLYGVVCCLQISQFDVVVLQLLKKHILLLRLLL